MTTLAKATGSDYNPRRTDAMGGRKIFTSFLGEIDMKNRLLLASAVAAIGLFLLTNLELQAEDEVSAVNHGELAEAARQAYEESQAVYERGRGSMDDVYRWSARLKSAEIASGVDRTEANAAHLERMQELYERIQELHEAEAQGGSSANLAYAKYYWLEAKHSD